MMATRHEPEQVPARQPRRLRRPFDVRDWLVRLLRDEHLRICTVFSVIVLVMPAEGIPGVELCAAQHLLHVPCPGCGVTRCGANLVRGRLGRAIDYHPIGVVMSPIVFLCGVVGVLPRRWRDGFRAALLPWARVVRLVYLVLLAVFLAFGVLRTAGVFLHWMDFPGHWF